MFFHYFNGSSRPTTNLSSLSLQLYMDGAASDNVPRIDEHTVTVSPFAGASDICPGAAGVEEKTWARWERPMLPGLAEELWGFTLSGANVRRMVNILYPPGPDRLSDICKQGFSDTLKYLQTHREFGTIWYTKLLGLVRLLKFHSPKVSCVLKFHVSSSFMCLKV